MKPWFPIAVTVLAAGLMIHEMYSMTWKARIAVGTYELRRPGEFAKDQKQYVVSALSDPREFKFLPPAPEPAGLIKFTSPHHGKLYIDGESVGKVYAGDKAGCHILRIECATFTLSGCPV